MQITEWKNSCVENAQYELPELDSRPTAGAAVSQKQDSYMSAHHSSVLQTLQ